MHLGLTRALVCALALATSNVAADSKPKPVNLEGNDIVGHRVSLRELRGQIVVVNFWATWCGPCKEELPALVAIAREYSPRGVDFVGASLDETSTRKRIPEFIERYQIGFPVWSGATSNDLDRLKMGPAVPATALIDRTGEILFRFSGEFRPDELRARLDWMLGDRAAASPQANITHLGTH